MLLKCEDNYKLHRTTLLFLTSIKKFELKSMSLNEIINNEDPVYIDVREPYEFIFGHIKGAINIPLGKIQDHLDEFESMERPIVLYCRTGFRSGQAVAYLKENGIDNTINGINKKEIESYRELS